MSGEHQHGWTPGRVAAAVAGSVIGLFGAALLIGGIALVVAAIAARDSDGYYSTDSQRLTTSTYALTLENIDLGTGVDIPKDLLGHVRIRVKSPEGKPVFVGIARKDDVDAYLRGVGHARVKDFSGDKPTYETKNGGAPRGPPGSQRIWVAKAQGPDSRTATWKVKGGTWSVVAMNANATPQVVLDTKAGAKVGWVVGLGIGLIVVGLLVLGGAIALIVVAARRASRPHVAA